jgi:hypothetical protein
MAKKEFLAASFSAPRHPRSPDPSLQEILLSPRAFPIPRFSADPPATRGMIWKRALQPPFAQTYFQNEGWIVAHRDGLVFRPISVFQTGMQGALTTLGDVLPAAGTMLGYGALRAGKDIDPVPDVLEALANWASDSSRAIPDAQPSGLGAGERNTFCFAFVDIVEAAIYQINYTGLHRLNNNGQATSRHFAITLEDSRGRRSGYTVIVYDEKLELMRRAFMTARIRAEIAWLSKEFQAEALGPTFWPTLFSQHAAALEGAGAQPAPDVMAQLLETAKQAREHAGLTEARMAAAVLERMAPTLAALRQVPAWDPRGKTDLELLAEKAGQL